MREATALQRKRAEICREMARRYGQQLTARQGVELLEKLKISNPKSLSRELSRLKLVGLNVGLKPPYTAMSRLMEARGTIRPSRGKRDGDERVFCRRERKRIYKKRVGDEGRKSNGLCPRCEELSNTPTGLTVDGAYKYCAACGWEEQWPAYLPVGATI